MLTPLLQTLAELSPSAAQLTPTRSPLARAKRGLDHANRFERALACAALACAACQFKSRKGATMKHMSAWLTEQSQAAAARGEPEPWALFDCAHSAQGLAKFVNRNLERLSVCGLGVLAVPKAELQDAKARYRPCGELLPHPLAG